MMFLSCAGHMINKLCLTVWNIGISFANKFTQPLLT